MADGAGTKPPTIGGIGQRPTLSAWLFGTRNGWLTLWAVAGAIAFATPIVVLAVALEVQFDLSARWYMLAGSTVILLPLILFFLDPAESVATGPRIRLPAISIGILATLTSLAVIDATTGGHNLSGTPQRTTFFAFLALAFAPRVWNAALFAVSRARSRKAAEAAALKDLPPDQQAIEAVDKEVQLYRNTESIGALLSTLVIAVIVAGAFYVGSFKTDPELGSGLGVVIFAIVICIFAAIVFLDWIARFPPLRSLAKTMYGAAPRLRILADIYDWIDTGLVRLGSHIAGADHLKTRTRYSILCSTLICLALLAWFLPTPLGLVPVFLGLVLALSLSRLWSWVEDDRDMAAATQYSPLAPQRVGFREDFRDETLLGFIFVLILLPIGMMQAHEGTNQALFVKSGTDTPVQARDNFWLWLGYFGFELAKALPIVDWADIYNLGPGSDSIEPTRSNGMHAVFVARALVDLILIAALLQAIGIATRNNQQKALFGLRRIFRLDELVERSALGRAIRETRWTNPDSKYNLDKLSDPALVDFRHYDLSRLKQLYAAHAPGSDERAFIDEVLKDRKATPAPTIDVARDIAETHRNELALFKTFEQALAEHRFRTHPIDIDDIQTILFALRRQSGFKDFKQHLVDVAIDEIASPPQQVMEMLTTVAVGKESERDAYKQIANLVGLAALRVIPKVTDPQQIADSLRAFRENGPIAFGSYAKTLEQVIKALEARLDQLRL